jgi:spermidine synthase
MSSKDEWSSRALADLGCAHLAGQRNGRVLVGGLGMGFTLRAALDHVGPHVRVEVAELVPGVVAWNETHLGDLASHPLRDPRTELRVGDVRQFICKATTPYDAILLDVDNGPEALAHDGNAGLYRRRGLQQAWAALTPGGVLAVWSFSDDPSFSRRLRQERFVVAVHKVRGSKHGRGKYHVVWVAQKPD